MKNKGDIDYSLYLVTDRPLLVGKELLTTVEKAIQGGVTVVQIREKELSTLEFYKVACEVKKITTKYGVPLIINDRLDIALAVDADGLHIGQKDLPLPIARQLLGREKLIGVSVMNERQALLAVETSADYLGIGAIFPTATKDDADQVSLGALEKIKKLVDIPVVAIGGIQATNIEKVMATGVDGAAVVSAIISAADPYMAASSLRKLMKR